MAKGRKLRRVILNSEDITKILTSKESHISIEHPLPEDARLFSAEYDGATLYLTYESKRFPSVRIDEKIPEMLFENSIKRVECDKIKAEYWDPGERQ